MVIEEWRDLNILERSLSEMYYNMSQNDSNIGFVRDLWRRVVSELLAIEKD